MEDFGKKIFHATINFGVIIFMKKLSSINFLVVKNEIFATSFLGRLRAHIVFDLFVANITPMLLQFFYSS